MHRNILNFIRKITFNITCILNNCENMIDYSVMTYRLKYMHIYICVNMCFNICFNTFINIFYASGHSTSVSFVAATFALNTMQL